MSQAKTELARINEILEEPLLLVGGLAVNQYIVTRVSEDIDLVVDFSRAIDIVRSLYPSLEWDIVDENKSEIRPSYKITHKENPNLIVYFGPKILEREPYPYIDYDLLLEDSNSFEFDGDRLENIRVPSTVALSYSKLISFASRKNTNEEKAAKDLDDFVQLTNQSSWNTTGFYSTINRVGAIQHLENALGDGTDYSDILEHSSAYKTAKMLIQSIDSETKKVSPERIEARVELAIESAATFFDNRSDNWREKYSGKILAGIGFDLMGFCNRDRRSLVITGMGNLIRDACGSPYRYRSLGDTFVAYYLTDSFSSARSCTKRFHEAINSHDWTNDSGDQYCHSITTFDLVAEDEQPEVFFKRLLDSLLSQKEDNVVFRKCSSEIVRNEMSVKEMVNYTQQ